MGSTGQSQLWPEVLTAFLGAILLTASATKLVPEPRFAGTLTALGIHGRWLTPKVATTLLAGAELLAFLGLTLVRGWVGAASLILLGSGFAAAGLIAIRRRIDVPCNCFGSIGDKSLGWRQVAAWPVWLGAASLLLVAPEFQGQPIELRLLTAAVAASAAVIRVVWMIAPMWSRTVDRRLASLRGSG